MSLDAVEVRTVGYSEFALREHEHAGHVVSGVILRQEALRRFHADDPQLIGFALADLVQERQDAASALLGVLLRVPAVLQVCGKDLGVPLPIGFDGRMREPDLDRAVRHARSRRDLVFLPGSECARQHQHERRGNRRDRRGDGDDLPRLHRAFLHAGFFQRLLHALFKAFRHLRKQIVDQSCIKSVHTLRSFSDNCCFNAARALDKRLRTVPSLTSVIAAISEVLYPS